MRCAAFLLFAAVVPHAWGAVSEEKPGYTESVDYRDVVRRAPWRAEAHTVGGWDWSLPEWVKPSPTSGLKCNLRTPSGEPLPYNKMIGVGVTWAMLEPEEGAYAFQALRKTLDEKLRNGWCVELHLRYCTDKVEFFKRVDGKTVDLTTVVKTEAGAAPAWLKANHQAPTIRETPVTTAPLPFAETNYDVYHAAFYAKFFALLDRLREDGVLSHPAIRCIYIHEPSVTRGEEGEGPQEGQPNHDRYVKKLEKWSEVMGRDVGKLVYTGFSGANCRKALALGMGQRNGFVEMYLRHVGNKNLGLALNEQGYIAVDEAFPPFTDGRAWGDENEEYTRMDPHPRFGALETFPHRYLSSTLMALVMRRNVLWLPGNLTLNPELTAYLGLTLGKTVADTPDAWCCLRESRIRNFYRWKEIVPYKNFERWLWQRDAPGAETRPVRPVKHGLQMQAVDDVDHMARAGRRIRFTVHPAFYEGWGRNYVLKVSHYDNADILVRYHTDQGFKTQILSSGHTDRLVTSTLLLEGLAKSPKGLDLLLEGKGQRTIEVAMVRLIHRDPKRKTPKKPL